MTKIIGKCTSTKKPIAASKHQPIICKQLCIWYGGVRWWTGLLPLPAELVELLISIVLVVPVLTGDVSVLVLAVDAELLLALTEVSVELADSTCFVE